MIEVIDQAFCQMISRSGIHRILGLHRTHVKTLRRQMRLGQGVSLEKKLKLLKATGWDPGSHQWTDQDMMDLVRFCIKQSEAAKAFGPAYILEKWKDSTRY